MAVIFRLSQHPRNRSQGAELLAFRIFREQKQKDNIDRLAVDRVELDRFAQPQQHSNWFADLMEPCMRQGHAAAHTGGAEFLAFAQLG